MKVGTAVLGLPLHITTREIGIYGGEHSRARCLSRWYCCGCLSFARGFTTHRVLMASRLNLCEASRACRTKAASRGRIRSVTMWFNPRESKRRERAGWLLFDFDLRRSSSLRTHTRLLRTLLALEKLLYCPVLSRPAPSSYDRPSPSPLNSATPGHHYTTSHAPRACT